MDLSVIMASWGHRGQIEEALGCILEQSHPPLEVIVVDDASTDGSADLVDDLTYRWPALRQIRCHANQGPIRCCRLGTYAALGSHLHFAAADDRVEPGWYERVAWEADTWRDSPQGPWLPGLVCGSFDVFGLEADGREIQGWGGQRCRDGQWAPGQLELEPHPVQLAGATAVYRRDAYLGAGGLRPELESAADWFLSATVASQSGLVTVSQLAARCMISPETYSGRHGADPAKSEDLRLALGLATSSLELKGAARALHTYARLW